ncbi:ferritin [Nitzschia inconspicua]|uniref:Ferritin n=1 Tax=Nitzschia inconspicua TaxID=303405 RepID=A0A9K3PJM2_9STRA|nr:ferritin [Nitzschia inconspicua]
MKLAFLVTALAPTGVLALQGNYLSQLSNAGASVTPSTGNYAPSVLTHDNFFPVPDESTMASMSDLYSSAPPGSAGKMKPAFIGGSPAATSLNNHFSAAHQELIQLWSDQVSVELSASQLYLSASIWFRERDMAGMAAWMLDESGEERGHGLAILEFGHKRKFPISLKALDAPKADWQNPVEVWESILEAEQTNTQNLLRLAKVAEQCGEYACQAFLDSFHIEQLEAEDKVGSILAKVKGGVNLADLDFQLGLEAEEEGHH